MHSESLKESWLNYLKKSCELATGAVPYFFQGSSCGTCFHWFLINEDDLHHLAVTSSPKEYDEIIEDLNGKRHCTYREKGEIKDGYCVHRFYGWCRRFPPVQRNNYSILGFRSLFTFLSRNIPQKIAEYDFPLMPHLCSCGEWKKGNWVESFVNEVKKP